MCAAPSLQHERASRAWREARTGREAWARFRNWLARTHAKLQSEGDAPWWAAQLHFNLRLWTGPRAKRLVLFQKEPIMNEFLWDGRGSDDRATRWGMATATAPFAPNAHTVTLLRGYARLLGGPVGLFGDLDPHGLHTLGALRSGNLDAPSLDGKRLKVEWLGIDDGWLRRVRAGGKLLQSRLIRMGWVEQEYWSIIKRLMPGVRALVGEESFHLLERGLKAETDAFRDMMVPMLRSRLKRVALG